MAGQGGNDTVGVKPTNRDGAKPRLAVRAFERFGGQRRLIVAAVLGFIAFNAGSTWLFGIAEHCGIVHFASQFAGSGERFSWLVQRCSVPATVQQILLPDFLVMFGYWLMFSAILIGGWWRFEAPALRRASWVLWLPTIAVSFDIIEYFLLARLMYKDDDGQFALLGDGDLLNWAQMAVSSAKWIAVAVTVVASLMAAAVSISRRADPFPPSDALLPPRHHGAKQVLDSGQDGGHDAEKGTSAAQNGQRVGICLGGGGIQAAAFCLGVLSQLEAGSPGLSQPPTRSARYLAAVSGGAWAASAWTLQRASRPMEAASDAVVSRLQADDESTGYARHNYLLNQRGGIVGAIGWVLFSSFTNLLLFGLLICLAVWPLGLFMTHCAIDSGQLGSAYCAPPPIPHDYFYAPSIVFAALGLLWLVATGLTNGKGVRTWPIGVLLLALSIFLAACLIWIPAWFRSIDDVSFAAGVAGSVIAATVSISIASGIWTLLGGRSMHNAHGRIGRWIPRLLGVLLLAGAIAWALIALYVVAKSITVSLATPWGTVAISATSQLAVVIPAAILLAMYLLLGPNWPTLHNILSARLRRSFDPVANPFGSANRSPENGDLPPGTWAWLRTKTEVPELILCCAQQRNGISKGGLRAETFTISPHFVRQGGARSCRTADYIDAARQIKRFPRGPQDCGPVEYVSGWLATTGAGFSSAPGRMSLGSTNALLAAVNADVGVWLPNVKELQEQCGRQEVTGADAVAERDDNVRPSGEGSGGALGGVVKKLLPRPRFAYTLKKILGWYHVDDRYIFVTDGGHWDNLGLVELLRRECDVIYCVDASGDPPDSFATLRQTLQLAALELDCDYSEIDVEECLNGLSAGTGSVPAAAATTFTLTSSRGPDGAPGKMGKSVTVHYTKLQATQDMSAELKRWAVADPKFPRYSTLSRFLTAAQFENLVELGRNAGAAVLRCGEDAHLRRPGASPTEQVDTARTGN